MTTSSHPDFAELVRVAARIGCLSFGGPAGQIALMHRELVEERGWISEEQYLHALNFCHLLPGPEAQQLAIWIGWKLHGIRGGLAGGLLFVLPGALVILALSMLYGAAAHLAWFAALFLGIKAAVLAIVVQAVLRLAGRALGTSFRKGAAAVSFLALFLFNAPFPLVVIGAGLVGWATARWRPALLGLKGSSSAALSSPRPWGYSLKAVLIGATVWATPMVAVLALLGRDHVLWRVGVFFSKLAVVTFGGAYAVLAYMAQQAVSAQHWLSAAEMADGLGLAETTPGPLIMVTQFVGYLAAFRAPEPFTPLVAGLLGAGLTTWVTFAPCFLWVFALAPWIERLERAQLFKGALGLVTSAIVGVIASLSAWFALQVLFRTLHPVALGPVSLDLPMLASFDWRAGVIALASGWLVIARQWNIMCVLALATGAGWLLFIFP
ncbi:MULTISPECIES: chromate efflux transporter [unclassified Novosphingobium]|uniref:chromate efflux transporter n=1 Tax=unclassified Novosphingobium TaxID=2644732 RepID=UPI000D30E7B3|nr:MULTISPECIES: chromate efflux transporter [unclassified Novosphingobium]PTR05805.1 chromate transporter [Novosphingobium sp. GV055]PUA94363.1 chromate transporter [Novosphingobium sp. GV061]PUB12669.1 chromate transporter [Novosphingobium sp. GV079]PUB38034.1 chromate transporter [Novosphingobium sp. GV027]